MRRPLIAGNWKMNGSRSSIQALLEELVQGGSAVGGAELAVFPPFVYLDEVRQRLADTAIAWGAQNCSEKAPGAYTGEVAVSMLLDFDCRYTLVGHSERRTLYGETDEIVAAKVAALRKAGIRPMLCIGETLEERDVGSTAAVVARQLDAVLRWEGIQAFADIVIAYEPVWAIGTGKTASPEQAQEVHAFIRGQLAGHDANIASSARILYGGSVKASNAAELFAMPDIDGGLIGGASLNPRDFLEIAQAAG